MADSDHQELSVDPNTGGDYALSGKIMLTAVVVLFAVVVFLGSLHLYARWYLLRLRRRQAARRRNRRTHIVFHADTPAAAAADSGLDLKVLNSLPLFLHSATAAPPPECAVCLSEFEDKEIGRLLPKCNHSFHIDCIDMWFRSHSTCPLCRSPVEHVPAAEKPSPPENEDEPGPSSDSGDGATPSGNRRKGLDLVGVRIEVPPRTELMNELSQGSPGSRLLSRILSMGRKSPMACGGGRPRAAGTSGEVDLESGLSESTRVARTS